MKRRTFLGLGGALAVSQATSALARNAPTQTPKISGMLIRPAPIPASRGARVVVVGGGWSGLTMARYLKKSRPAFDVVLIDRNEAFVSPPLGNLGLADQVEMGFLTHSYLDAARHNRYFFFQASVVELDRESRRIFTDQGAIQYDYLVVAPGIDYDYSGVGVVDEEQAFLLRSQMPAGFAQASEYYSIKRKLHTFKGGTFVLNVPTGNYRCLAAPYERACMVSALFKKRGINAKVVLLDANPDLRVMKDGFTRAFKSLYGDMIEYQNNVSIASINPEARELTTADSGALKFDDGLIYPPIRASRLIEQLGLMDPASPQFEADIDPLRYHLRGDEHVYVTGDARSQPFSKSANTAHSEARYVAEVIAAHADSKEVPWRSPQTLNFSAVKIDPLEAMSIISFYRFVEKGQRFVFDRVHRAEGWTPQVGQASIAWAEGLYKDVFYS